MATFRIVVAAVVMAAAAAASSNAAAAQTDQRPACVSDQSGFATVGKAAGFLIALDNACAQRQRCKVNAYIVTARGPKQVAATLMLRPGTKDQAARKTRMIELGQATGSASLSRDCKAI